MADLTVGPVVTPADIEAAVCGMLKFAFPYYLGEVDVQKGLTRGSTAPPRMFIPRGGNTRWAEEAPPVLVVACPGTTDTPARHGDRGSYGAWWQVNIAVTAGGATEAGSHAIADRHLGALMLAMAQQPDMPSANGVAGLAQDTVWQGARIDLIEPQRTLLAVEAVCAVYVNRVVDTRGLIPRDIPDTAVPVDVTPVPTSLTVRIIPPEQ